MDRSPIRRRTDPSSGLTPRISSMNPSAVTSSPARSPIAERPSRSTCPAPLHGRSSSPRARPPPGARSSQAARQRHPACRCSARPEHPKIPTQNGHMRGENGRNHRSASFSRQVVKQRHLQGIRTRQCPLVVTRFRPREALIRKRSQLRILDRARGEISADTRVPPRSVRGPVVRDGFPLPFGRRRLLSRSSFVSPGIELSSRSANQLPRVGPGRGLRVPHARAAIGEGCPVYSGDNSARPDRSRSPASARRNPNGQSLHPATTLHPCEAPE